MATIDLYVDNGANVEGSVGGDTYVGTDALRLRRPGVVDDFPLRRLGVGLLAVGAGDVQHWRRLGVADAKKRRYQKSIAAPP